MDASTEHILIAGGSGFLGQELATYFIQQGKEVKILSRRIEKDKVGTFVKWDAQNLGDWVAEIEWADVLINLTGKSVNCRYTEQAKQEILSSRIESTQVLCKALSQATNPPHIWINSSSASTYIHSESQQMTEDEGIIGDDFSMNVCKAWEAEFFKCNLNHTRRVATRTSIVLGKSGGAYPIMTRLVKCFLGGRQGNGQQFISWIHVEDFCRAMDFIIDNPAIVGPVNVTSPTPVRNSEFMRLLRKRHKRPFGLSQSRSLLEFGAKIIGTETEMVMKSRNVIPERLTENDFSFKFSNLDLTFKSL
ncbi:MAG: TIGR01777 family oxidoreductase [Crocinitomicaceae bacterium]